MALKQLSQAFDGHIFVQTVLELRCRCSIRDLLRQQVPLVHQTPTEKELADIRTGSLFQQLHIIIRPHRSHSAAAYSRQTLPWTICRSVRASVCLVHCGKTADRIRMLFCVIGWTGPGMRQVVGFWDRSTGRGTFGDEFGARHCNQWELYGVRVRQRLDAALFPNYFGQACYYYYHYYLFYYYYYYYERQFSYCVLSSYICKLTAERTVLGQLCPFMS